MATGLTEGRAGSTWRPGSVLRTTLSLRAPLLLPLLVFALPLLGALLLGLARAWDGPAWSQLWADSQTAPALSLSLWVGLASTGLSLTLTLWLVTHLHGTPVWLRVQRSLGSLLAVPHAAFAIGLALLLMPSGLLARLLAPLAGWAFPPAVATVQDAWGLSLILGLVLKEVPFLLWNVVAQLQRVGQGREIERQLQMAASMGYPARSTWWRVLWPQLLPRLALPLLAVWAYGLTVVDMALVLGPTLPPPLAVLAWQWLRDADDAMGQQGAAAAVLLTVVMAAGALAAWLLMRALKRV
ncbi:MAG: ABC transporter permease, partial [Rhizobacter sp.]|nr:ABC transporter permease [Rhizobacter sp.]